MIQEFVGIDIEEISSEELIELEKEKHLKSKAEEEVIPETLRKLIAKTHEAKISANISIC